MTGLIQFWASHSAEFTARLGQHIMLVAISTSVSAAIGVLEERIAELEAENARLRGKAD